MIEYRGEGLRSEGVLPIPRERVSLPSPKQRELFLSTRETSSEYFFRLRSIKGCYQNFKRAFLNTMHKCRGGATPFLSLKLLNLELLGKKLSGAQKYGIVLSNEKTIYVAIGNFFAHENERKT